MKGLAILAWLPDEFLPLFFAASGLALILGFKKTASYLFTTALLFAFIPVLLDPILDLLPDWALYGFLVFICLGILGSLISFLVGKKERNRLAGNVLKWIILFPFRVAGSLRTNRRF